MLVRVLGAAAGGGFPQWNCGCPGCESARIGRATPRTQDSIAVSADGTSYTLVNASPDVLVQIQRAPWLSPTGARRSSPIRGIVLTNGDLDHTLGLFSLRESQPLAVFATDAVRRGLEKNPMLRTLQRFPGQLAWHRIELGRPFELEPGLTATPIAAPGKVAKHLEGDETMTDEHNIALVLRSKAATVAIATAAGGPGPFLDALDGSDALLFDGTFWSSDELVRLQLGTARAEDMAHWPIGGTSGSLEGLRGLVVKRKIYTHINNTNPILVEGSSERRVLEETGWEVAFDGLEVSQ